MAIKVKAVERLQYVGKYAGQYRYVLQAEMYNRLDDAKVIEEAALRSGMRKSVITAAWNVIGEVIKAWATEGHSVALPGLGTMRFGVRATSVASVSEVGSSLITCRRIIFLPGKDIKDELLSTNLNITCYDRDGKIVKQVISDDVTEQDEAVEPDDNSGQQGGGDGGDGEDTL